MKLREASTLVMDGRAWYPGALSVKLELFGPEADFRQHLVDYLGGVLDTLDGSSGNTFTFLPIVYEDDCQVAEVEVRFIEAESTRYAIIAEFL